VPARSAFESDRLILRPFEPGDAPALVVLLNHPDLAWAARLPGASTKSCLSHGQVEKLLGKWCEGRKACTWRGIARQSGVIGHAELDWGWDRTLPLAVDRPATSARIGSVLSMLLDYFSRIPGTMFRCGPLNGISRPWLLLESTVSRSAGTGDGMAYATAFTWMGWCSISCAPNGKPGRRAEHVAGR
jgi:hypothetical protein